MNQSIKTNHHTHYSICRHAEGSVDEYINRAIKLGYKTLAITEHIPFPKEMTEVIISKRMYIDQLDDYINEINSKKEEYKNKIEILLGLECEYLDFLEPLIEEVSKKCDFLILGQHYIKVKNKYKSIYNVSEENYLDIYFSTAHRALSTGLFKIFAHPDIFLWKVKDWNPYCEKLNFNQKENGLYLGSEKNKYLVLVKPIDINITSINVEEETIIILDYAFENCSNLENISMKNNIIYIGEYAFFECIKLETVTIPEKVTELAYNLFCGCDNLETVNLPEGLLKLGSYTFAYCRKLKNVTIPNTVLTIAPYAFYSCVSIKKIIVPDSVTRIEVNGFYQCSGLEEITLSKNLEYIGNYAFYNCSSLKEIIIPDKITLISSYIFAHCSSLTKVVLPETITTINLQAFENCINLKEIYISKNVNYIGDSAFLNCKQLTIYCEMDEQPASWESTWNRSNCNVIWNHKK